MCKRLLALRAEIGRHVVNQYSRPCQCRAFFPGKDVRLDIRGARNERGVSLGLTLPTHVRRMQVVQGYSIHTHLGVRLEL